MSIEFPSAAHPPFEDEADQKRVWGRRWGCTGEVGILKLTLMQPPAQAVLATDPGRNMPAGFSSDEADEGWYWQSGECAPRTDLPYREMEAQWQHLVDVLQHHGVKVVRLNQARGRFANFTRDVAIGIDGGVVVCRLAGATRRGEENAATRTLAGLGVPIIRTITGTGLLEGGSFAWINGETAVVGRSNCVNEEGAAQLEEVLHRQGVELIRTDLSFNEIHLDGVFNMLDADVALVERLGDRLGLSGQAIGLILSAGTVFGLLGGIAAAILGTRYGRLPPLLAGLTLQMLATVVCILAASPVPYVVAYFLWSAALFFVVPFLFGTASTLDSNGRWAAAASGMLLVGQMSGPALAGWVVHRNGYDGLLWMLVAVSIAAVAMLTVALRLAAGHSKE